MAQSDLVVSVGANIAALERQMRAAAASSEKAAADIEARFSRLNPSFSTSVLTGALKGFAAAFTVDKLIRGLAAANAELVRMGETAKRVGLDVQRFQELQFAGKTNGLSGRQFGTGLEGLAEKLNEARQTENALTKLFDDNNIKLKDRKGEVIGINDALGKVAGLVQNAATEFDKIKIAEAVGLTRDWVPLLEQGAAAIDKQAASAQAAGAVIDSEIIGKAKEFERNWAEATERWATLIKANAGTIISLIDTIISKASGLAGYLNDALKPYAQRIAATEGVKQYGVEGVQKSDLEWIKANGAANGMAADVVAKAEKRLQAIVDQEAKAGSSKPLEVTVQGGRGKTDTSSLFNKGGGGGGGGKSDEEKAQDRLERYIETLMRQNEVLDAQIATFGKSNAEKRAAVELAKAQVDLNKLDEADRARIIASLTKEIELSEQKRTKLDELKRAQDGLRDAQKFFGDIAVDSLTDLIVNGAKAQDVIKSLTSALVKAALQAALLGSGPLAGIFGTAGTNGNVGGLIGFIGGLKLASGGFVSGGGSSTSDSIPARLSNGEFVVNAASTRQHRDLLEAINNGRVPMLAKGGLVGQVPDLSSLSLGGTAAANGTPSQPITLSIDARHSTPDAVAMLEKRLPGLVLSTMVEARRRGARV